MSHITNRKKKIVQIFFIVIFRYFLALKIYILNTKNDVTFLLQSYE